MAGVLFCIGSVPASAVNLTTAEHYSPQSTLGKKTFSNHLEFFRNKRKSCHSILKGQISYFFPRSWQAGTQLAIYCGLLYACAIQILSFSDKSDKRKL